MLLLVVEDDTLVAMLLAHLVGDAGHTVLGPAAKVSTALEFASQTRPDFAFLDIRLLDGSGLDVARELKRQWAVPCLFMSAEPERAWEAADSALGVIGKPCGLEDVLGCIRFAEQTMAGIELAERPLGLRLFPAGLVSEPRPQGTLQPGPIPH